MVAQSGFEWSGWMDWMGSAFQLSPYESHSHYSDIDEYKEYTTQKTPIFFAICYSDKWNVVNKKSHDRRKVETSISLKSLKNCSWVGLNVQKLNQTFLL